MGEIRHQLPHTTVLDGDLCQSEFTGTTSMRWQRLSFGGKLLSAQNQPLVGELYVLYFVLETRFDDCYQRCGERSR